MVTFSAFGHLILLCCAMLTVVLQWLITSAGLVHNILSMMRCRPPDLSDPREKMFANIIEEVVVATGGRAMRGMVIPSLALNAFSVDDGDSTPVIGVTRGLLYRLNRAQLETVVGHEAAHIVSEDCEQVTLISAMFDVFAGILAGVRLLSEGFRGLAEEGIGSTTIPDVLRGKNDPDENNLGLGMQFLRLGYYFFFVIFILVFIYFVNFFATLMRMFISRNREYRADAVAVRLTRDPLALAEALYIILRHRRSLFDKADSFETLFILNPKMSGFDEDEGFFADLLSTHPPVGKRIQILLDMAHADNASLDLALAASAERAKDMPNELSLLGGGAGSDANLRWFVRKDEGWLGPFNVATLQNLDWIRPDTVVRKVGGEGFSLIRNEDALRSVFEVLSVRANDISRVCPSCGGELVDEKYEGIGILRCARCEGVLASEDALGVIVQRRQEMFSREIHRQAATLRAEHLNVRSVYTECGESDRNYRCGKCANNEKKKMVRRLFNAYYPVEIDKCMMCGLTWFDKNELDILQCMAEQVADSGKTLL